jgi:hypothetical protein
VTVARTSLAPRQPTRKGVKLVVSVDPEEVCHDRARAARRFDDHAYFDAASYWRELGATIAAIDDRIGTIAVRKTLQPRTPSLRHRPSHHDGDNKVIVGGEEHPTERRDRHGTALPRNGTLGRKRRSTSIRWRSPGRRRTSSPERRSAQQFVVDNAKVGRHVVSDTWSGGDTPVHSTSCGSARAASYVTVTVRSADTSPVRQRPWGQPDVDPPRLYRALQRSRDRSGLPMPRLARR